jgi:methionyl-tRNA formyltransferase
LKILFAGTPQFAAKALEAILGAQHEVVVVLTQPDRPAGRGMQLTASPVKQLALQHNLPVLQPNTLKDIDIQRQLANYNADVMVVAAYGLLLPRPVLEMPRYGCLNIHASLLPRWRGAAPVQRAILAGDHETGVTIMQMDEGLDTGDMLLMRPCRIDSSDTAATLLDKLTVIGAEAVLEALNRLCTGELKPETQDSTKATYANKLAKTEAALDWNKTSDQLQRAVHAYNPFPVANATLNQATIKIWQATAQPGQQGDPGQVLSVSKQGILVACGEGALNLEVLQRPNNKAMSASQFIQGFPVKAGDRFETT